ncbi:hypothetical protein J6500_08380 [Bradyrhizobium sp. WSM 1704]|uniref:hypothetical protein n=1 Tax=Bradyrhizobium semiaridum TaxID=2821404 RepID=UPI001CE38F2D|nr:hypothetical protein [Bradyrhizobium semiaridum]MCA6121915.1 hypothetical protein [Bradyrhizobium semiaridum]
MRILLTWTLLLMSWPSFAASDEFPTQLRGLWGEAKETCDYWRTQTSADVRGDHRWLKVSTKDVLGSTQGRFLREVSGQVGAGATADISAEIQILDARGAIVLLSLSADGQLHETLLGAGRREIGIYQRC